ncbi:MAG: hypothetical protein K8U03_18965 [Planctomycetia bacterium]|nr:hypothetical protein [Planctomycetia bacterium]
MEPASLDLAALVPHWNWGYSLEFAVQCLLDVALPGWLLTKLFRLRSGCRAERWATVGLLGVLFNCFVSWGALAAQSAGEPASLAFTFELVFIASALLILMARDRAKIREGRTAKNFQSYLRLPRLHSSWEAAGYVIIAMLVCYYLVRTVPLFDFDGSRLRLYGAAFTDKTTNMMSCAALIHDVPPDCLRFAGHKFPSHYFPHLFSAKLNGLGSEAGIPYLSGFWFYVPTLGIVINGLAILAFARRVLKSYAAGCIALLIYGLTSVTPALKPLDITPAATLLGLLALDRFLASGRKCWVALSIVLIGTMPCFEAFHAFLMLGAIGLWGGVGFVADLTRRRTSKRMRLPASRLVVPALMGIVAFGSLQLLYLGERPIAPPRIVVDNVFGDSYRNTWQSRLADDDTVGHVLANLDHWKRKPSKKETSPPSSDMAIPPAPVAWYQRVTAQVVYTIGLVVYVFCRFVHIAILGVAHLVERRRKGTLRASEQIIAAAALIGFTVPWVVDVGITAGGQWWSSPNLYRPTEFGSWLLATLGSGVLLDCVTHRAAWKQRSTWALLAVAGYWLVTVTAEHLAPATTYLEVTPEQMQALAYMRENIPYGSVILHPWSDCEIRDAARSDAVSFIYKRHFTLGSNLAGRTMYYEGREDYTFSNGFIAPEEVYRRSRGRKKFYTEPDDETIDFVLKEVPVEYVVEDAGRPAPEIVRSSWPVVFESGGVKIRRRP